MYDRAEIEIVRKRLLTSYNKPVVHDGHHDAQFADDVLQGQVDMLILASQIDALNWLLGQPSMLGERLAEIEVDVQEELCNQ